VKTGVVKGRMRGGGAPVCLIDPFEEREQ
jgi:hypothetical protein